MKQARSPLLTAFLAAFAFTSPVHADDDVPALKAMGKLSPIKKTEFGRFSYLKRVEGKKRPVKAKALLRVGEQVALYRDVKIGLRALKIGQEVWLLGTPDKQTTTASNGSPVTEYRLKQTVAIVAGEALDLSEGQKVGAQTWVKGTVSKTGGGLRVKYDGQDYQVLCAKRWAAMLRVKLPKHPKKLKGLVEVVASRTEKPADLKAKETEAFDASRVVILDRRLTKALYPLLLR